MTIFPVLKIWRAVGVHLTLYSLNCEMVKVSRVQYSFHYDVSGLHHSVLGKTEQQQFTFYMAISAHT